MTNPTNKEALKKELDRQAIQFVLSDPRGRRFYRQMIEWCGVFRQVFTGNSETFFKDGKRVVGLHMLQRMDEAAPEAFALMMQEGRADDA